MPRLRHAGHVAPTARRRPAHRHARLQVVNQVGDERDEDEEDQDDQEDDDVALHFGGSAEKRSDRELLVGEGAV